MILRDMAIAWGAVALVAILLACGTPAVRPDPVPAEVEADQLEDEILDETREAVAADSAAKQAESAATVPGLTPEQIAAKRAEADRQRATADRHRALAAELAKIRDAARARAVEQRDELDRRADAAATAADNRRLGWIAGVSVALSAGGAGLLTWLGLPLKIAWGIPGAVMIAALTLSAWIAAAAWIGLLLGVALVLGVIGALVLLLITVLREWHHAAASASEPGSAERDALDATSRARQAPWIRRILDHLLPLHDPGKN
jgi:hypothetical protein